jgi:hypothetical protein
MAQSFFLLSDGTYGLLSWTYDDGMLQDPNRVSLRPADDIPDDSGAYPADTPLPPELEEEEVAEELEGPTVPPLDTPAPIDLAQSFPSEPLLVYYGKTRPFAMLAPLPGPTLQEMRHPKDTLRPIRRPPVEMPALIWPSTSIS